MWAATIFVALTMLLAGAGKFDAAAFWRQSFVQWGYPAALVPVVGLVEMSAAVALLSRRWVIYAAVTLMVVMLGAEITVLVNDSELVAWQPLMYLGLLSFILAFRLGRLRRG